MHLVCVCVCFESINQLITMNMQRHLSIEVHQSTNVQEGRKKKERKKERKRMTTLSLECRSVQSIQMTNVDVRKSSTML